MPNYFAKNANANSPFTQQCVSHHENLRDTRPYIVLAGPENFSCAEMDHIRAALVENGARVEMCRITEQFRIREFAKLLTGCSWLLLGVNESPGRELQLLQTAERERVPKVGIIALGPQVRLTDGHHVGGSVDLYVKRRPRDPSFGSFSRVNHILLAEDLASPSFARDISRITLPNELW